MSSSHFIAHPGPAQHFFNLLVLWLHQHSKLQVLNGVLMSTEHLLHMNKAEFTTVLAGLRSVPLFRVKHVRAAPNHDNYILFPLTVSWGRDPSTWVRLWYICSAVPSRNRPHPPIKSVSPNKQIKKCNSEMLQMEVVTVSGVKPNKNNKQVKIHTSSHLKWCYVFNKFA